MIFGTLNQNQNKCQRQLETRSISELLRILYVQKNKLSDEIDCQNFEHSISVSMNSLQGTKGALMKIILTHGGIEEILANDEMAMESIEGYQVDECQPLVK